MIGPLDGDASSEHGAEDRQFRPTEPPASFRRRANRTVVFDEKKAVPAVIGDARHVTLAASNFCQGSKLLTKRTSFSDELAVSRNARMLAVFDQFFQSAVAKKVAHGLQQIERQIGMTVGEAVVTSRRQPPIFPWSTSPLSLILAFHQTRRFELEQMLTCAGRSHAEARPDVGSSLRSAGLQVEQDAILAAVFVLTHHGFNLESRCYLN